MRLARSANCAAPRRWTVRAASRSVGSACQFTASAMISASVAAGTASARRWASSIASPSISASFSFGRSRCNDATCVPNWSADARPASVTSAPAMRGVLACASMVSRASVSASSASRSSTRRNCGDSDASSGKRRSSDWQKAWIVPMRMPPGRSSTCANRARAAARVSDEGATSSARSSRDSGASSSVTHLPRVFCSRTAISAAAALVKVRHWMRSGAAPDSIRRSRRSVSSLVAGSGRCADEG
jgi:hypothetical protein